MKRPRKRNNGGMTLTEVIVAMALVCIGALIITMAVAASQTLIRRGTDAGTAAWEALSNVEQGAEAIPGTVRIHIGGAIYTVDGNYLVGGEDNIIAAAFEPDLSVSDSEAGQDSGEEMP